jgi:hypothetical protein
MSQFNKLWLYLKMGGYVLIPLVLWILPANFFDSGRDLCLSKLAFNKECYGCGMTRGVMHLIHFDFSTAYSYNKLCFIVFPIVAFLWATAFFKDRKGLQK